MKTIIPILALALAGFTLHAADAATHRKTAKAMHPKITAGAAMAIAQGKVPAGKVKSHELEREKGHLIYSFDFVVKGKSGIDEVNVDAMTGAVIAVAHEGPKAERQEAVKEKKEAAAAPTAH